MDVCLLWVLCALWSLRRADHSSKGVLPSVAGPSMIRKFQHWVGYVPLGLPNREKKKLPTKTARNKIWLFFLSIYYINLCQVKATRIFVCHPVVFSIVNKKQILLEGNLTVYVLNVTQLNVLHVFTQVQIFCLQGPSLLKSTEFDNM